MALVEKHSEIQTNEQEFKFSKYLGNNLPVINNLEDLKRELRVVFESDSINVDFVNFLMKSYKSNPADWKTYAKFDRFRYTRNLVDTGNGNYNLMAVCWGEGHGSAIHDHSNSHCFMKMLQGTLEEVRFAWPENDQDEMVETGRKKLHLNETCYINDSIGLHRVQNPSSVDTAISLHLYSPPYNTCKIFNEKTGKQTVATCTFYSLFGKRNKDNVVVEPEDN